MKPTPEQVKRVLEWLIERDQVWGMMESTLREALEAAPESFYTGDRVRVPDGREGRVLWVIPTGTEVAIALDDTYGSFHIHPSHVELVQRAGDYERAVRRGDVREAEGAARRRDAQGGEHGR